MSSAESSHWSQREQRERMNGAWEMLSGLLYAGQLIPQRQAMPPASLPLTVLSGFLGAGKTTLLNRLLAEPRGTRLVVIVNDFGRINIDARLIASQTENTIGLSNGCVCCSLAGDLTRTLIELTHRNEPPDAIILEASGLANPQGIVQVALANPALRLDGVVTMVDADAMRELAANPDFSGLFRGQLMAADLLVLNKLDLLDPSARGDARAWLQALAPQCPIVEAVEAEVPTEIVLGVNRPHADEDRGVTRESELAGYQSWSVSCNGLLDGVRVRQLLEETPICLLRAKGVLWLSDHPHGRTVYQRVGRRASYAQSAWRDQTPDSAMVFIGPSGSIEGPQLQRCFEACRVAAPASNGMS